MVHAYLAEATPVAFAHRGGARRWPENTLLAFRSVCDLGYRYIETDLHETADGHLVCFHDDQLERTTNGYGPIREHTLSELQQLDAAHRFERDGSFAYRGQGVTIPTLDEALSVNDSLRYNLEVKPQDPTLAGRLWNFIEARGIHDRVLVASQHDSVVEAFRGHSGGQVATSAGFRGALRFWLSVLSGSSDRTTFPFDALQIPPTYKGRNVITPAFVEAAHRHGIQVHVWTINDPNQMRHLLSAGADAVMTDLPDVLLEVLAEV